VTVAHGLATAFAILSLLGLCSVLAGLACACRFRRRLAVTAPPPAGLTLLRPLCGAEPALEQALASTLTQAGPGIQVILGVQDPQDPAIAVVRKLQALFPDVDLHLVIDATMHGPNRKVSNLINMMALARHDILVFCDSDLHVAPDYLAQVAAALAAPGVGLVTTVCAGLPVVPGIAARLGATWITHSFAPSALLSRALGWEDCLGTTMALRRATLDAIGGLAALAGHLADDNVLGALVNGLGLRVVLAPTVPATAVPERRLADLWHHEMRWSRTIGALEPLYFAGTVLLYPLAFAIPAALLWPGRWSTLVLATVFALRFGAARLVDHSLGVPAAARARFWVLPLRDLLSVAEVAVSSLGSRVVWRGQEMHADPGLASKVKLAA
jgi:ceramide glucosyltransferase